jgi:hypothetical protein
MPHSVAAPLAAQADAVAAALGRGDVCGARAQAAILRRRAHVEPVPAPFRADLLAAVDRLAASVPACLPPAPTPTPPPPPTPPPVEKRGERDHGKHKGKHKRNGHHKQKRGDD